MARKQDKDRDNGKTWLTVQLMPGQTEILDAVSAARHTTKTDIIRTYIKNIDKIDMVLTLIETIGFEQLRQLAENMENESRTSS